MPEELVPAQPPVMVLRPRPSIPILQLRTRSMSSLPPAEHSQHTPSLPIFSFLQSTLTELPIELRQQQKQPSLPAISQCTSWPRSTFVTIFASTNSLQSSFRSTVTSAPTVILQPVDSLMEATHQHPRILQRSITFQLSLKKNNIKRKEGQEKRKNVHLEVHLIEQNLSQPL